MKLLVVLCFLAVTYADLYDDADQCLLTNEAAECFRVYANCRKNSTDSRDRRSCLSAFDKCVAGPCPEQCHKDYKDCQHKARTSNDIFKCVGEKGACQRECLQKIHE